MKRLTRSQILPVKLQLVKQQGGICPLCQADMSMMESKNIVLDHDHATGAIREALCRNCNGMEGKVKNYGTRAKRNGSYIGWLKRLIAYYEKHAEQQTDLLHPTHRSDEEKRLARNAAARKRRAAKRG